MTSNDSSVPCARWRLYLVLLVLMCQTAGRVQGHPRASTKAYLQNTGSSSTQQIPISRLIEAAYERQELLRPKDWPRRADDHPVPSTKSERDISRQSEYLTDKISTPGERRLLEMSTQVPNADGIIFPTDDRISSMLTSASTSDCHSTFCENVTNYPTHLVNDAIARNSSLRFLENVDELLSDPVPDIEHRIKPADEKLCDYVEHLVYPQTAQNKEKQWLFVVNLDGLKQRIRVEICLNDGQECNVIKGFAENYKTTCKQKFIYRELLAMGSNGNIVKDQFRFPSSCCCHIKNTGDPTVRLGLGSSDLRFLNRTAIVSKTRWRQ